jgi:hypothetical protein
MFLPVAFRFIFALVFFWTFGTFTAAAYADGGGDMQNFIGKNINSADVKSRLANLGKKEEALSTNSVHVYPDKGIIIQTQAGGIIWRITLYGRKEPFKEGTMMPFKGYINDRLRMDMTRREVIENVKVPFKDNLSYVSFIENQGIRTTIRFAHAKNTSSLNFKISTVELTYSPCLSGDCLNGFGVYAELDGLRYEGNWKNGKYHGEGKLTEANGRIKDGIWENGIFKGKNFFKSNGLYDLLGTNVESDRFKTFLQNQKSDYRKLSLAYNYANMIFGDSKLLLFFNDKGNIYKFQLHKSRFSDYANGTFNDNSLLTSDEHYVRYLMGTPAKVEQNAWYYNNDKYTVKIIFGSNKTVETVEVRLDNVSALTEKGECRQGDCINGFGELKTPSGRYVGAFKNGKFEGHGSFSYKNSGQVYVGNFKNHQRDGKGFLKHADGKLVYDGEWADNEPNGYGKMYYPDKNHYAGQWLNGVREGYGVLYFANGERYEGYWKNDLQNGAGTLIFKDGKKKTGFWENGKFMQ